MIGALILAGAALSQENKQEDQTKASESQETQTQTRNRSRPRITIDWTQPVQADWNKLKCDNPQNHDEADLCEQRRMADAAQETVWLNRGQIAVGLLTLYLLWRTVRWTRQAATAANEAAAHGRTAAKATRDSADALPALERAYVFIEVNPDFINQIRRNFTQKQTPHVTYRLVNHGKTPAIIKELSAEFRHLTDLPSQIRYLNTHVGEEVIIIANERHPPIDRINLPSGSAMVFAYRLNASLGHVLDDAAIADSQAGGSFLWFYGNVIYNDVFGQEHETRFCRCYNGLANSFQPYNRGDEGLNRRT